MTPANDMERALRALERIAEELARIRQLMQVGGGDRAVLADLNRMADGVPYAEMPGWASS